MKIKSFGCSFTYGSDVDWVMTTEAQSPSEKTWPSLIAQTLGLEYECYAWPGVGNFQIYCQILNQSSYADDAIFLVNWTWADRFDFVGSDEKWDTLRPGSDRYLERFYYKHIHSDFNDMIYSLSLINSAILLLRSCQRKFLMTFMDNNLFQPIDPDWHDPRYFEVLQKLTRPWLKDFDGMNFLDWSRSKGYPISDQLHPLEQAHRAAADYALANWRSAFDY